MPLRGTGGFDRLNPAGRDETRRFDRTNLKPHKLTENAHAVLKDGSPTTTPALAPGASVAPAFFVGDRVHVEDPRSGLCWAVFLFHHTLSYRRCNPRTYATSTQVLVHDE
jgi:hypothetical protein